MKLELYVLVISQRVRGENVTQQGLAELCNGTNTDPGHCINISAYVTSIMGTYTCISYDDDSQLMVLGFCPYYVYQKRYLHNLNSTTSLDEVNEIMCGPLNREGMHSLQQVQTWLWNCRLFQDHR